MITIANILMVVGVTYAVEPLMLRGSSPMTLVRHLQMNPISMSMCISITWMRAVMERESITITTILSSFPTVRVQSFVSLLAIGASIVVSAIFAAKSPSYRPQVSISRSGSITGRVIDEDGYPVTGAEVHADRADSPMGRRLVTFSNQEGVFSIKELSPGVYTLSASNNEKGYLRTDSAFHVANSVVAPQVTVGEQQAVAGVVIRVGPKGAKLRGSIIDFVTRKAVKDVQITLRRIDNPNYSYSTGPNVKGEFEIIVPAEPFTIEVSAPGYETWAYKKDDLKLQGEPIKLSRGEIKELIIGIRPRKQPLN